MVKNIIGNGNEAMALTDIIATALFSSFGVWLLIAPVSVIRFYNWFIGGLSVQPKPLGIRIVGLGWIILVITMSYIATRN